MFDTMPQPQQQTYLPRNDSFSSQDISKAFQASAQKPRNNLSLRVVKQDETTVPPPSPLESRPSSIYSSRPYPESRR
ncbi:hypothetical protein MBLNU230_g8139t1 [Neophaeotheca triangularis]